MAQEPSPGLSAEESAALLAAASRGDAASWGRIVEVYGRRIFALARSRVRSSEVAEEIAQSVFATLATKVGSGDYAERGRFEAWIFRVAMNRIRDEARRRRRAAARLTDFPSAEQVPAASVEVGASEPPMLGMLREAVARLSEADREVIELRHHGQMSFKAMSELLGEPVGTLLARHHRALRKLREMLAGGGAGESDVLPAPGPTRRHDESEVTP